MLVLKSILPILLALGMGYLSSRLLLPQRLASRLVGFIGPLVWLLLFLIGAEFGEAVSSLDAVGHVLKTSSLIVGLTTVFPGLILIALAALSEDARQHPAAIPDRSSGAFDWRVAAAPMKECLIALLAVALGVLLHLARAQVPALERLWLPSSNAMLMLLIFLVGVDLSAVKIGRHWLTWHVLSVPLAVVLGSVAGACVVHLITGDDLPLLLALSTGFGWFTLSSVLIGSLSGEIHGATALLVDLGRELIAVMLLYLTGRNAPRLSIAAAGATALDSTLPIVRQTCHADMLPIALVSGFVLTVLAPFFITLFLSV